MSNQDYLMSEQEVEEKMPNWVPDSRPGPTSPSAPPVPNPMPGYFQGSLPPTTQHDTSFVGTEVGTPRIPKTSLMPLSLQSNAFTNAAVQSTAQKVASTLVGGEVVISLTVPDIFTPVTQTENASPFDLEFALAPEPANTFLAGPA